MKIAAYLGADPVSGGGFQQSLNAALQMQRICKGLYDFAVYTPHKSNLSILADHGLVGIYCPDSLNDKIFSFLAWSAFFDRLQVRMKLLSKFEKTLLRDGVDLVYFLAPKDRSSSLQLLNHINTVWDVCHRDFPEFPEVRSFGEFTRREISYRSTLPKAYCIIADSEELKRKIISYYTINADRILVIPFQPAISCSIDQSAVSDPQILKNYDLEPGYLFYPAQFWCHKGHVRLLQALSILRERHGHTPTCVFSGGEAGNLDVVKQLVDGLSLTHSIRFLGFVPNEHVPELYRGSSALVMPTYFGPTNLPPLEALSLGIPIIYPIHLSGQCGDAAIYFDVDDPVSLCDAIKHVLYEFDRNNWLTTSAERLTAMKQDLLRAEAKFGEILYIFERRLSCWVK